MMEKKMMGKVGEFFKTAPGVRLLCVCGAIVILLMLPLILEQAWISLASEMLIMALAGCALNLIMGYTGMVSFGPAGLYAVGAYATALILKKTGLPFVLALGAGPLLAGIIGIIIGWFCVRRSAVYFALLTLAFAQIIWTVIFQWYDLTSGDDGIVGFRTQDFLKTVYGSYYFILIIVLICLVLLWLIVNSPFGKTLQAIRENPVRTEFIGINVRRYQLYAFVISSVFLGMAGSLFAAFSGSVFPDYAHWGKSTDMIVICLLGGMYNFLGPVIGSVVYIFLCKLISGYTMYWMLFLGIIIIFLVLFMRNGIAGFISKQIARFFQKDKEAEG